MNEFHHRKKIKELAEWKKDLVRNFKIKASKANTDVQLGVNKYIEALDNKIKENNFILAKKARAGDGSWESINDDLRDAWILIKSAAKSTSAKF